MELALIALLFVCVALLIASLAENISTRRAAAEERRDWINERKEWADRVMFVKLGRTYPGQALPHEVPDEPEATPEDLDWRTLG